MNKILQVSIAFLVSVTGFATPAGAQSGDIWKIGVLVCLTGACAESGNNSMEGINLAVDEINKAGGVLGHKLQVLVEDTDEGASSGAGAVTAFKKLTKDRSISYFIGPSWTPGGLAVAPLAAKRPEIIITSPSLGVSDFNRAAANIFNVWPHDEYSSKFLAKYAFDKGWKRIAVFSSQQPWESVQGDTFDEEFRRLGGKVVAKEVPLPTISDLRSEALRIRNSKPDAVFLSNFTQMGVASKQLRGMGYKGPFLAILMDDTRIETAQGGLEKTVFAGYPPPDTSFSERFRKRYSKEPGIGADTSYDVVKIYAWAVNKAQSFDTSKTREHILQAELPAASGLIKFDDHGGVKKKPILYQVVGREKLQYDG